jgi:hypothetical protein
LPEDVKRRWGKQSDYLWVYRRAEMSPCFYIIEWDEAIGRLEALGHEVVVADPNFAPMYATRDKKIKTDKRDNRRAGEHVISAGLFTRAVH